jgi:hypothetical protein
MVSAISGCGRYYCKKILRIWASNIHSKSGREQYRHFCDMTGRAANVRFSNRPLGVKRLQAIHHCSVDVAHGLVLLFGLGTKALPSRTLTR